MFEIIDGKDITETTDRLGRQYLCGNLKFKQELREIKDDNVEVGLSAYTDYKVENAHFHTSCSEYQYVISGRTKYLDLDTNEEYEFSAGDFFVIRPHTRYYQKAEKDCRILFFKYPGGNDKVLTEITEKQKKWGENYNV